MSWYFGIAWMTDDTESIPLSLPLTQQSELHHSNEKEPTLSVCCSPFKPAHILHFPTNALLGGVTEWFWKPSAVTKNISHPPQKIKSQQQSLNTYGTQQSAGHIFHTLYITTTFPLIKCPEASGVSINTINPGDSAPYFSFRFIRLFITWYSINYPMNCKVKYISCLKLLTLASFVLNKDRRIHIVNLVKLCFLFFFGF